MDWNLAVERNSIALKRIVAMLVGMAGLSATPTSPLRGEVAPHSGAGGGDTLSGTPTPNPSPQGGGETRPTLPRRLHRAVLRLLRPAESAVRRLIALAARGLVAPPSPPRPAKPKPPSIFLRRGGRGTGILLPRGVLIKPTRPAPQSIALPLFDPLKRPFRRHRPTQVCVPRISYPGPFATLSPVKIRRPPTQDDRLDATRLTLRINALAAALNDLPAQAKRLARWRANRDAGVQFLAPAEGGGEVSSPKGETERGVSSRHGARRRFRRISPLRPGRPPGSLRRPDHEVHDLLTELHGLAFDVLEHPDTS